MDRVWRKDPKGSSAVRVWHRAHRGLPGPARSPSGKVPACSLPGRTFSFPRLPQTCLQLRPGLLEPPPFWVGVLVAGQGAGRGRKLNGSQSLPWGPQLVALGTPSATDRPTWSGVKTYGLGSWEAAPQPEAPRRVHSEDTEGGREGGRGTRAPRRAKEGPRSGSACPPPSHPGPRSPLPPGACLTPKQSPSLVTLPLRPARLSCLYSQGTALPWASASPYRRPHAPGSPGLSSLPRNPRAHCDDSSRNKTQHPGTKDQVQTRGLGSGAPASLCPA